VNLSKQFSASTRHDMKLKLSLSILLASLAFFSAAQATVTVVFNAPFSGGMSSNLANTSGVVSNGMKYGILVDTTGNGIRGTYDPLAMTQGMSVVLTNFGASTGDCLILATDLTSDSSQGGALKEGDFTTPGGNGGVTGLLFALSNGVAAGQSFRLVWYDAATDRLGVLASAQFIVPADGQTVTYAQVFEGVDPVRSATNIAFPEPSTALLGVLGALSLLRRRR
jgi:hypothetical protein